MVDYGHSPKFLVSFFCYYLDESHVIHRQELYLSEIGLWISAYRFTHPACVSISTKIWFDKEN